MINATVDYALRVVTYLAAQEQSPRTGQVIAEITQVPAGYLSRVMSALVRAQLVVSQRGLHGGYTLGVDPKRLTAQEVLNAVCNPRRRQTRAGPASDGAVQAVGSFIADIEAQTAAMMQETTVKMLAERAKAQRQAQLD